MHKKLASDLTSLAHSILQMKNKEDVFALKKKALEVYEKLALLTYVEEYINNTTNPSETKEELLSKIAITEEKLSTANTIFNEEKTLENEITETIAKDENTYFEDMLLVENKDRDEIPFIINEPIEEPFIQEQLFSDSEIPSIEKTEVSEITEQPFDELENILFSETDVALKEEKTPIISENTKTHVEETNFAEELNSEIIEELPADKEVSTPDETQNSIETYTNKELENEILDESTIENDVSVIEEIETHVMTDEADTLIEEPIPTENILEDVVEEEVLIKSETTIEETQTEIVSEEIFIDETEDLSPLEKYRTPTLEEELGDTISVDVMANLFEKAPPKTLNDKLVQSTIKIDLNDRIAFVNHLFEGNQEDFNRVISQLNTIKTERSAKQFILKMIKPEYDWSTKESYEARLLEIIERRFGA